jgi:LCP family protein required for cell wall assembly
MFGTSEDDPGHDAPDLTDSIMVVSVDQDKKDAFMVSIPRDLHVQYGQACAPGYQGKINALYACGKADGGEDGGSKALRTKVGEILGLDIQYSVHVNYTVLRQAVQAVGGIRVTIESVDPRGQMDSNFDWKCGVGDRKVSRAEVLRRCPPNGHFIDYPNGPVDLDAEHALYLAQARGDGALTYGFPRSNPDRQDNQRKILIALKDKAVSAGVLANPVAINNLLDALGNNLRTTFEANEIKTLVELSKNIKTEDITSFSLENKEKPLTTAGCFSGNICPNAGHFNYSAIQTAMNALSTGDKASLEYAKIDVLNASGTPGLAQTQADKLREKNLTVVNVGNAPTTLGEKQISFYDMTGKKSATLKKLKEILGVEVTAGKPAGVTSNADFVVIIGKRPEPAPAQTQQ